LPTFSYIPKVLAIREKSIDTVNR